MDATMEAKVTNDAAAYMKGLATTHERNATWAEQAVRESVSLTAEEAKATDVIEFVAVDLDDLLRQLDGYTTIPKGITLHTAGAPVVQVPMSWRDRLLHTIVDPNIAFILLLLGIYGLIFEFQSPGLGLSGVAGAIALLVALYAMQALPVSYVGLALIVVAMVLYVAEVKIQSYGALGLAGTIALILGGLLLFDVPGSVGRVSWVVIAVAAALSFAFFAVVVSAVARARRRPATTGSEAMTGEIGVARTRLDPSGQVLVHGELWKAHAEDGFVGSGEPVEVVGMDGLELHVRRQAAAEDGVDETSGNSTTETPK
jgi:membrane-bound serine protease (ClpP class)